MNLLDFTIILIIIFSCIISYSRGFIYEACLLTYWFFSFFLSKEYYSDILSWLEDIKNVLFRNFFTIVLLTVVIFFIKKIIFYMMLFAFKNIKASLIDKYLGVIFFGASRGLIISSISVFACDKFSIAYSHAFYYQSYLVPYFRYFINICSENFLFTNEN